MSYQDNGSNFQALTLPKFLRMVALKVDGGDLWGRSLPDRERERERKEKRASTIWEREVGLSGDRFFT